MESKYLKQFKKLSASGKGPILHGDRLIVEVLPKDELKKGGIIIAADLKDHRSMTQENRAQLCMILMTGAGYEDEDGETQELPYKPGEIILVSDLSLKPYTQFPGLVDFTPNDIALSRTTEIHMSWDSIEHYEEYKAALNS